MGSTQKPSSSSLMNNASSSSSSGPPEWLLEVVDSTHTCRICYVEFNDTCKVARILACGHSFCTECLQNLVRVANLTYPTCPECRKVTRQSVTTLPVNFQFMQMLRKMNLTVENQENDETSSTAATVGCTDAQEPILPGELDMANQFEGATITSMISQLRGLVGALKNQFSHEIFRQILRRDGNFYLTTCADQLDEISDLVDSMQDNYQITTEQRDPSTVDLDDFDVEDDEEANTAENNNDPDYDDYDGSVADYSNQGFSHDDWYARSVPRLAEMFNTLNLVPTERTTSQYGSSSQYTSDMFIADVNRLGQSVWRCSVCDCQVPYGCEESHSEGRRHRANHLRRQTGLPIIETNQWRDRFRRRNI